MDESPIIADEASAQALAQYCPDLENWAQSWCYEQSDLVQGQRIVKFLKPFLLHLLNQRLSAKTLHKHRDAVQRICSVRVMLPTQFAALLPP